MPENGLPIDRHLKDDDVLTLEEAAEYLRVAPEKLARQVEDGRIPAQSVAGEWRFLKSALAQWLKHGRLGFDDLVFMHPLMVENKLIEWLHMMEERIDGKLNSQGPPRPKRGSKEALMKYFGVFRDEENSEELLASLRATRGLST